MANKKYLDEDGLAVVATKVNEKLKVVSTMPSTPTNGQVVLYVGATTSTLTQGGIYLYNGTSWTLISTADVDLTPYKKIFTGTQAEWNQLTLAEKKEYDEADLTDDLAGGELVVTDAVTDGDLNPVTSNAVAERTTLKSISITAVSGAVATVATSETSFAEGQFVRVNVASGVTMSGFWGTASALSDLGVANIQVAGSVGNSSRTVIALGVIQKSGATLYLDIFG